MCGIVGAIAAAPDFNVCPVLLNGLARLEYRGYDSAGVALADGAGGGAADVAERRVTLGRTAQLRREAGELRGRCGIGHTRWATHGAPSQQNAHPIRAGRVLVAHNGIIENHGELRRELQAAGRRFSSDTDTEVIAHLLDMALAEGAADLAAAWRKISPRLQGAYAVAALADGAPQILGARHGSPLLLGQGTDGFYLASDALALASTATRADYLENGEHALLTVHGATVFGADGGARAAKWQPLDGRGLDVQLGEYTHFMQKEIFEQPDAVAATLQSLMAGDSVPPRKFGAGAARAWRKAREVNIVACGTSYHAGLIAAQWLEKMGIAARADIASEYRPRPCRRAGDSLFVAISQSGETADTLAAMRAAKASGAATLAVVNVPSSSMRREADFSVCTRAGPEIGVASTKAFTAQLAALLLTALAMARARGALSAAQEADALHRVKRLPHLLTKALLQEERAKEWARQLAGARSVLFIGRRAFFPLALEGALKLKEISYIHAEGGAAGELKHGALALVDGDLPVIGLAPDDAALPKTAANLSEVAARGGQLFILAGQQFSMPEVDDSRIMRFDEDGGEFLAPMAFVVALQLIAYYTARQKGTDIDKPRNLAKAVTVE